MRVIGPTVWLTALVGALVVAMTALAYTTGQAQAGQQVYTSICIGCHGPNLQGVVGPALVGGAFQATWQNAAALFNYVSQNMPLNNPGSLSREQYWNVVAFLLQRNGIEPDEQPLNEETAQKVSLRQG